MRSVFRRFGGVAAATGIAAVMTAASSHAAVAGTVTPNVTAVEHAAASPDATAIEYGVVSPDATAIEYGL